ncbi:VOC family protein [Amphibacillus sediminis]|uniref:VOC family protein n=1 Tax=Amphibacillus sediminis TaxID=360185 RepID=UPI000829A8B6|nr:VOC family protein [Amphibacillus sediminis]
MLQGSLHHLELYVSDLKRSTQFWGWFLESLGYQPYQKWKLGQSWRLGETYIVFVQTEAKYTEVPYHRCQVGLNHLAFQANSRQHVDTITDTIKDKGIPLLYPDKHPYAGGKDHYAVYFEDPDRIKVELVAPH